MKNAFPAIMKTLAIVASVLTGGFLLAYAHWPQDWLLSCAISFGTTGYHFLMRLVVGFLVPAATDYAFDYRKIWFQPRPWEAAFYKMLKIKTWKGRLPTYAPGQFSLENQSLHRIIQNMCGAEIVHEIIMVLSFVPVLTVPVFGVPGVFWSTSVLAALFDSLFVLAQRFNRPRLVRIYEKQEAKRP